VIPNPVVPNESEPPSQCRVISGIMSAQRAHRLPIPYIDLDRSRDVIF
jgi:hypothetical protein